MGERAFSDYTTAESGSLVPGVRRSGVTTYVHVLRAGEWMTRRDGLGVVHGPCVLTTNALPGNRYECHVGPANPIPDVSGQGVLPI